MKRAIRVVATILCWLLTSTLTLAIIVLFLLSFFYRALGPWLIMPVAIGLIFYPLLFVLSYYIGKRLGPLGFNYARLKGFLAFCYRYVFLGSSLLALSSAAALFFLTLDNFFLINCCCLVALLMVFILVEFSIRILFPLTGFPETL